MPLLNLKRFSLKTVSGTGNFSRCLSYKHERNCTCWNSLFQAAIKHTGILSHFGPRCTIKETYRRDYPKLGSMKKGYSTMNMTELLPNIQYRMFCILFAVSQLLPVHSNACASLKRDLCACWEIANGLSTAFHIQSHSCAPRANKHILWNFT